MSNLYLLQNSIDPDYGDCIGAVVVAETALEARHIYPELDYLSFNIKDGSHYGTRTKYDPVIHQIEQTPDEWFIRNLNKPTENHWSTRKDSRSWDVNKIKVTHIGTTDLPIGTVVLSSNAGG